MSLQFFPGERRVTYGTILGPDPNRPVDEYVIPAALRDRLLALWNCAEELVDSWIEPALTASFTEEQAIAGYQRTVRAVITCREVLGGGEPTPEEVRIMRVQEDLDGADWS